MPICCGVSSGKIEWILIIVIQKNQLFYRFQLINIIQILFTMSRYAEKKLVYKPKGEQVSSRYGFVYDQSAINYRTEIPELPEKPKHKPDEKVKEKRIGEINDKIQKLKDIRKEKKDEIKKINSVHEDELNEYKEKVALGRKCIQILEFEIEKISDIIFQKNRKINFTQNQITDLIDEIREIKSKQRSFKKVFKKLEEMTNQELDEQKNKIQLIMSTKNLTKKEEAELNNTILRISRLKLQLDRPIIQNQKQSQTLNVNRIAEIESKIQFLRGKEEKIKNERAKLYEEKAELQFRIEDIRQDINLFFVRLNQIADLIDQNVATKKLSEETKSLKDSIQKIKQEITKVEEQYEAKLKEYEIEQEKIKWIGWATKIQEKLREEWQAEKAERKKQKLREKAHETKKEGQKTKDQKDGQTGDKPVFERKKINRNQKQIDICTFLIDYCRRLYPQNQGKTPEQRKQVNKEQQIKKAKWVKGLQIVQSKKSKVDDEDEGSKQNYNRKRHKKEEEAPVASDKFIHEYFVEQYFHAASIIPPTKTEQLEKIIKDLEDKVDYYLSHPDEGVEEKFAKDKKFVEKSVRNEPGQANQAKYTKSKGNNKNVINTEDFPAL